MNAYPHLFQPIRLGPVEIKNRVFSPAHGTTLGRDGLVTEEMIAYHAARAKGGAGLIILEGMNIHHTYRYPDIFLITDDDACIPGLKCLGEACHAEGCKVFGQLFHAGRAVRASEDGSRPVTVAPSATPDERYKVVPVPLDEAGIWEIVESYGDAAARLRRAGLDGVEIKASMGYLISQFLNPRINKREDAFGGTFEKRLRFLREVIAAVCAEAGPNLAVGIRLSGDDMDEGALNAEECLEIAVALDSDNTLDYFNVTAGTSASPGGWIRVFPPMAVDHAFVAPLAQAVRQKVSKPVLVAGRINQPQLAEQVIAEGQADMCGLARAMICDPLFVQKAQDGRSEEIRACIGCNQACVGHRLAHHAISCIQHPETGRELRYPEPYKRAERLKTVLVVGGGPAGLKAAAVAAARGHKVELWERDSQLGGQARLAQLLPGRAEFGGLITNLVGEAERAGVAMRRGMKATYAAIREAGPDAVILASGANSVIPAFQGAGEAHAIDAWAVIRGEANVGASVVVADWRCDWVGLGVAEMLARQGCRVRLAVNGAVPGEAIQGIVRDHWIGELHRLGVEMIPFVRLYGADATAVYLQHTINREAVVLEEVETLVTSDAYIPENGLKADLRDFGGEVFAIGDCLSPRTAEEAVLEGLKVANSL